MSQKISIILFLLFYIGLSISSAFAADVYQEQVISLNNSRIHIYIMGKVTEAEAKKLIDWIDYGVNALTYAYGIFPIQKLNVMIFPLGRHSSIVPWGEVKRQGGTSIHLHVDQTRALNDIINDWTLIHELSHTLHPYISMEGRWLSEGLATYYQNVLQARAGTLTGQQAWTKLHQGFQRGIKQTESGKSLKQVSKNMHNNHKFMRVYWSGTALWLKADWLLRTRHQSSLDNIMHQYQQCCIRQNHTWRAVEYMQKLDQLSKTTLFTDLYQMYAKSDAFPDLKAVYVSLGLIDQGKSISLNKKADHHQLFHDIMSSKY